MQGLQSNPHQFQIPPKLCTGLMEDVVALLAGRRDDWQGEVGRLKNERRKVWQGP